MRINHNIQALNAYRNLSINQSSMSKHLERLSSGLRINRAADDAAGLAISEKMRSQIRGLNMAERNTMDAISLIQTAEGALGTTHEILQRMRELAVQAANGTLEEQDRTALQSEMDQLTEEIDRIAKTTQFNAKPLLRGALDGRAFASFNSTELQYTSGGVWTGTITATPTAKASVELELDINFGTELAANVDGKIFTINGKTYELDTDPLAPGVTSGRIAVVIPTWDDNADDSAATANINATLSALRNVILNADPAFESVGSTITNATNVVPGDGTLDNNGKLVLKTAANMAPADAQNMTVSTDITAGASFFEEGTTNPATTLIAPSTSQVSKSVTLAFAEVPKDGDYIKIDDVTINFGTAAVGYGGKAATIDITGKSVTDILTEIGNVLTTAKLNSDAQALSGHNVVGRSLMLSTVNTDDGATNGLEVELKDSDFTTYSGNSLKINMQIGANSTENMDIEINVMDAASLGLARESDHTTPITTAGIDARAGLDISSDSGMAQAAISIIDNAINLVSAQRSKLGAYQNRMEHTISNLGIASENLTSAESRIRDADMAMEMSDFTKNNIINQAATAMLAQSNQLPQGILQLLK